MPLSILKKVADFVWGPHILIFVLGAGLYLSLRLKGIQVRKFFPAIRMFRKSHQATGEGNITPFQALMSALSGMVGSGNIAGVATAIVTGGPGAVFWMWVFALVSMATMYSESLLGFLFRKKEKDGTFLGGPMGYISRGLGWRWFAVIYACAMAFRTMIATASVQSNSMSNVLQYHFQISPLISCIVISFLVWIVIVGGLRVIAKTTQFLSPVMTLFYLAGVLLVLIFQMDKIGFAFHEIFKYAFTPKSAFGGFAGAGVMMAIRYGAARGAYSNEAGTGSVSIMHATAQTNDPVRQSLISMLGVFIDTIVICTMTALVIIIADIWTGGLNSTALMAESFSLKFAPGKWVVLGSALLFGYSTLITWSFYGEQCAAFVFGKQARRIYRWLFCLGILIGATGTAENIWSIGDILNGLVIIINVIAILALSPVVIQYTFQGRMKKGDGKNS